MNEYLNKEIEKLLKVNKKKAANLELNNYDIAKKLNMTGAFFSMLRSSKKKVSLKTALKMHKKFGWDKEKLCPKVKSE